MPTKFNRVTINATTYVVLDASIKGTAFVTLNNPSGVVLRIAGEADSAPAAGTTVYTAVASNSGAVYKFRCDPSKTWLLAGSGGGAIEIAIDY